MANTQDPEQRPSQKRDSGIGAEETTRRGDGGEGAETADDEFDDMEDPDAEDESEEGTI